MSFGGSSSAPWPRQPIRLARETKLPLVPCPECGEEIIELVCGEGSKVPGAIFFKCRLHERNVPGTCPWYLFADKYEKMLIAKGIIEKNRATGGGIWPEESLTEKTELAPLLGDLVTLKNGAVRVDENVQKLVVIGKIVALCLVMLAVLVVVGIIIMLVK